MAGQAQNYGPIQTFKAGGAITAKRLVELDANGDVTATDAITDNAIGVALQTVASGEYVDVLVVNGAKAKVTTSGAVAIGDQLMPTGSGAGKVITAAGATAKSVGIALSASAADGEDIEMLTRFGVNQPANS